MTEADFHRIATALPGATMEVLWGADRVYKVGGKMFAAMGPSGSLSFKASDIAFEMLTESGRARRDRACRKSGATEPCVD